MGTVGNEYIPHKPTDKQYRFLLNPMLEGLYGGAGGGGKSDALLMGGLQFVDVPGYSALILRKTYTDLSLPDALIPRSFDWLSDTDAKWSSEKKTWTFPSKATLTFGYLEHENDKFRYKSSSYQYIAFDELTEFTITQYLFLFSRLRRLKGVEIPLRMRSASNPGGLGHIWVKDRWDIQGMQESTVIDPGEEKELFFVPATMYDNPYLDIEEYTKALNKLDPVTRERIKNGDWDVKEEGNMFKKWWFEVIEQEPEELDGIIRYWDLAATEKNRYNNPCFSCGALMGRKGRDIFIIDVVRDQLDPARLETLLVNTAIYDGGGVPIWFEQEPGSSGKITSNYLKMEVFKNFDAKEDPAVIDKVVRARPFSAACGMKRVYLVKGNWNKAYLDELELFPNPKFKMDQVDASSGAYNKLFEVKMKRGKKRIQVW